jgi:hypothetical protein
MMPKTAETFWYNMPYYYYYYHHLQLLELLLTIKLDA